MNPVTFQEALIAAYIDNPCQVLPTHRGRGLATALVLELLTRVQKRSAFTTVSGSVNNDTSPERLYRRCGFTGEDVWWVLRR
ncbi:MAG: GNAT family N-acetyltransferase [Anaerolineales bacterium]|nr:GNAT family N-acetyltransferase [Anaerolineales bacterium]